MNHPTHQSHKIGIMYILIAWLFFTAMTLIVRFIGPKISIVSILLFQNFIGLLTTLPWFLKHGWGLLHTNRLGLLLSRTLFSIFSIGLSFLAVQKTTLVTTILLNSSSPLWIPFVLLIWRKLPLNHFLWPGLIGGFIGIFLILNPGRELFEAGAFLALGAGILQSLNMVSLRVLSYTERNHTVLFYYFLICSLLCLPFAIYEWTTPNFIQWGQIIGVGILFALGQWAFVRAFHFAKASLLGPFSYSAVVFAVLLDWIFFQEIPGLFTWIGIGLVCMGGIWAIRFTRQ